MMLSEYTRARPFLATGPGRHGVWPGDVVIEGGNHGQFGWHGPQSGDQEATISREGQQEQAVAAAAKLLADLEQKEKRWLLGFGT